MKNLQSLYIRKNKNRMVIAFYFHIIYNQYNLISRGYEEEK